MRSLIKIVKKVKKCMKFLVRKLNICYNNTNIMDCDKNNRRGVYGFKGKTT